MFGLGADKAELSSPPVLIDSGVFSYSGMYLLVFAGESGVSSSYMCFFDRVSLVMECSPTRMYTPGVVLESCPLQISFLFRRKLLPSVLRPRPYI